MLKRSDIKTIGMCTIGMGVLGPFFRSDYDRILHYFAIGFFGAIIGLVVGRLLGLLIDKIPDVSKH